MVATGMLLLVDAWACVLTPGCVQQRRDHKGLYWCPRALIESFFIKSEHSIRVK
jgi:hypothetical protein